MLVHFSWLLETAVEWKRRDYILCSPVLVKKSFHQNRSSSTTVGIFETQIIFPPTLSLLLLLLSTSKRWIFSFLFSISTSSWMCINIFAIHRALPALFLYLYQQNQPSPEGYISVSSCFWQRHLSIEFQNHENQSDIVYIELSLSLSRKEISSWLIDRVRCGSRFCNDAASCFNLRSTRPSARILNFFFFLSTPMPECVTRFLTWLSSCRKALPKRRKLLPSQLARPLAGFFQMFRHLFVSPPTTPRFPNCC